MRYEISIIKVVSVEAHNEASAIALAKMAVEEGLPIQGVKSIRETLPKVARGI
jgi:hypothetical protein